MESELSFKQILAIVICVCIMFGVAVPGTDSECILGHNTNVRALGIQSQNFAYGVRTRWNLTAAQRKALERECGFTQKELLVFRMKCDDMTDYDIACRLYEMFGHENPNQQYSLRSVQRIVRKIKNKILAVIT